MIGRVVIYGSLLIVLAVLASDPSVSIIGGPIGLSGPGGGLSVTDPSPIYLIPIALLIWVVLRRRKQHSEKSENED